MTIFLDRVQVDVYINSVASASVVCRKYLSMVVCVRAVESGCSYYMDMQTE